MTNYLYEDKLQSERLYTRFLNKGDIEKWAHFFEDKEGLWFFPDFGFKTTLETAEFWINKQLTRYAEKRYGLQALIDKNTNKMIGQAGLLLQEVDGVIELETGYHIFKEHRGKEYAPEAAKMFIEYAFKNNLSDSVISIIDVRNINSQRVAEKNGLTREKQTRWSDLDVYIYRTYKK